MSILYTKPLPGVLPDYGNRINRGIVGWYLFNEGGGLRINNICGMNSRQSGTLLNGPKWVGSNHGGGLYFDGVDDNIKVLDSQSDSFFDSPSLTYVAWINPSAFSDDYAGVVIKRYTLGGVVHGLFFRTSGKLAVYVSATTNLSYDGTGAHTLTTGKDYMIAFTYSASNGLVGYVNGVVDATVAANGDLKNVTDNVYIGYDHAAANRYYTGTINQVRIFNRALAIHEIKDLYQNPYIGLHGSKTKLLA